MIKVKLMGGLGNQMFQYAFIKSYQCRGYNCQLDLSWFDEENQQKIDTTRKYELDKFNINILTTKFKNNILQKAINKFLPRLTNNIHEKKTNFDKNLLHKIGNKYFIGYFQSEKYFLDIQEFLIKDFTLKQSLPKYSQEVELQIKQSINPVSIHIRRGDYITNPNANAIHGVCNLEYYYKAIKLLEEKAMNIQYFIFSDDIQWVKNNLKINNAIYIDSNEERIPHEDMCLMSLCKHNIIANSSFSWWGAWLNQNPNKIVVAPKKWFNVKRDTSDLIPHNWIRI